MTTKKLIFYIIGTLIGLNLLAWAKLVTSVSAETVPTTNSLACERFGVNFGVAYAVDTAQYTRAASHSMGWTLAIAQQGNVQATVDGVNRALANKLTPIVRIGVGNSSWGFINPQDYATFLNQVAKSATGTFYAVAGPNEPEFEHWLVQEAGHDPECQPVPGAGSQGYDLGTPGSVGYIMAGRCLAKYMKTLLEAGLDPKVKLLSPSFSLTGWMSGELIDSTQTALQGYGHSFTDLSGFSGTSYSGTGGSEDIATQIAKVTSRFPNLPIVLTEFADGDGNGDILGYKNIVDFVKTDPRAKNVIGTTFFCAFGTCSSQWQNFVLTDEELDLILGPACAASLVTPPHTPPPRASIRPCTTTDNPEFHPLRPYPGEPCDPLIPRSDPRADRVTPRGAQSFPTQLEQDYQMRNSVAFSCGNSLTPTIYHQFDKGSLNIPPGCSVNGNNVHCVIQENFGLTLDLTKANIPILGNTQTAGLTDAQKMTEYLSWYLNGTVQQSQQDPNPSLQRLVNFSGPLQKLLPFDLKNFDRTELAKGPAGIPFDVNNPKSGQYHNYIIGCNQIISVDLGDYLKAIQQVVSAIIRNFASAAQIVAKIVAVGGDLAANLGTALLTASAYLPDKTAAIAAFTSSFSTFVSDQGKIDRALDAASFILDQGSDITQRIGTALASLAEIAPNQAIVCTDANIATATVRLKEFSTADHQPPVPSQQPDFPTYRRKVLEWYGSTFLGFRNFGIFIPPLNYNVWSQLFRDIPFSSLEDTTGEVVISISDIEAHNQQDKDVIKAIGETGEPPKLIIRKNAVP